jgi:hypothetical protein
MGLPWAACCPMACTGRRPWPQASPSTGHVQWAEGAGQAILQNAELMDGTSFKVAGGTHVQQQRWDEGLGPGRKAA